MEFSDTIDEIIYQHEILRAKLEIRDHYFKTIVREIYENTGQVLSLVRIQLATLGTQLTDEMNARITASGDLVGRVICDLRDMSRNFYPEIEILSESGLINALKHELKVHPEDNSGKKIRVKGIPFALSPGSGLIFYLIILEITFLIAKSEKENSLKLEITYSKTKIKISIDYYGNPIDLNSDQQIQDVFPVSTKLGVHDRIKLIGGELVIKNKSGKKARIDVSMPYNQYRAA